MEVGVGKKLKEFGPPLLAYLVISVCLCGWVPGEMFMPSPDAIALTWFLNWWPFALSNNLDPFTTHHLGEPVGYNLWWLTSLPTLAVLGWPITATAGPIVTWNVISLLGPAISAYGCYVLLLYLSKERLPSFIGGLLFGFSTYQVGHLWGGHICLDFLALIPLMVLLVVARARRELSRVKFILLLSACAVLQFGISTEILATFGLMGLTTFAALYPLFRKSTDLNGVVVDVAAAAALSLLVVSPALISMYHSVHTMPEVLREGQVYSTDLLNFFVPHEFTWLGGNGFKWISNRFTGGTVEQGAYLGLPLLIIVGWAVWERRRTPWMLRLLVVLMVAAILSLGPLLQVGGYKTSVHMPWSLVEKVPLIRNALPMRLTMYVTLVASVMVALWLAKKGGRQSVARYLLVAVAIVFLMPHPKNFGFSKVETSSAFSVDAVDRNFGKDSSVIVLPYSPYGDSLLWQIESGMRFKMAGGYIGLVPSFFSKSPGWHRLNYMPLPARDGEVENDLVAFADLAGVKGFVIVPTSSDALNRITEPTHRKILAMPWERVIEGGNVFLKVPASESLKYVTVRGDYWGEQLSSFFWIGRQVEVVNHSSRARKVELARFAAPQALGTIKVALTINGVSESYDIVSERVEFDVPPHSTARLQADKTWVPHKLDGKGDMRALSVGMRIKDWDSDGSPRPAAQ